MARWTRIALLLVAPLLFFATPSRAEPPDPVLIGWWSFFYPVGTKTPTVGDPAHTVTKFGDPNTYFYEPSGGQGMMGAAPPDVAWKTLVNFVMAKAGGVTLSATFDRDEGSDLSQFTEAYFGWAFALFYVPKDKYCDPYQIALDSVDDGLQAMANAKICGYANLGGAQTINMTEYGTSNLVLRPGLNEIVMIHEDQAEVQRYIHGFRVTHSGAPVPLAPKNIIVGRVTDKGDGHPLNEATVKLDGGGVTDTFQTGPLGFYFFAGLANGAYNVTADYGGYISATATANVALGAASTEVAMLDIVVEQGCVCPDGTGCGSSGGCLPECKKKGEFSVTCEDPDAVCVQKIKTGTGEKDLCVRDACDTLVCPTGFACKDGTCVEEACGNVCCKAGEICSAGLCVPDGCGGGCPEGQICKGGACVPGCDVVTCLAGLECKDGKCLEECKVHPDKCAPKGPDINIGNDGGGVSGTGDTSGSSTGDTFGSGTDETTTDAGGTTTTLADGAVVTTPPSGGPAAPAAAPNQAGGCGCRLTGAPAPSGAVPALLGLLALALGRRRRRDD